MTDLSRKFLIFTAYACGVFFLLMLAGYTAVFFGWTNTAGEQDVNSAEYNKMAEKTNRVLSDVMPVIIENSTTTIATTSSTTLEIAPVIGNSPSDYCRIKLVIDQYPYNGKALFDAYKTKKSTELLDRMLLAVKLRTSNHQFFENQLALCANTRENLELSDLENLVANVDQKSIFAWQNEEPWQVIKEAILKDKDKINEAASQAGISSRMLVSAAIVEQLRLYYTQRELFEKVFKPLKILANANKMAWGVMSIKEKMAIETENHLKDQGSDFYLGAEKTNLLNYSNDIKDVAKERYNRLANDKDHYYSYLYGALILKQFTNQWAKAGYDIANRPEILATLFNIGYHNSKPKAEPAVGGSSIEIDGQKYQFGSLAYEFYYSGDLMEHFPF